jgi:hypothetical protein
MSVKKENPLNSSNAFSIRFKNFLENKALSITRYRPLHPRRAVPRRAAVRLLMGATSSMLLSGDFLAADGESLPMGVSVAANSVFRGHTASAASCQCLSTQKDKIQNVLGF